MLTIGDQAPDFELPNQNGETVKLSDYRGKKVILFSFPKADTSGCTTQACGFRDRLPQVETSNAVVFGISSADTPADLKAWQDKYNLSYDLLSDVDHQVLEPLGARGENDRAIRSYWVFDETGKIIAGQVKISPEDSVREALAAVGG